MNPRRASSALAFLASFLSFTLELIAARLLLPRFGGSAYVWTTCVMIFQALLLGAYLWSHFALRRWGAKRYAPFHLALLLTAAVFLPLKAPATREIFVPITTLGWSLLRSFAVPFFLLSTTTLVVQTWLAEADAYHLFAASNLGAAVGLLAYPFLIEPLLGLDLQAVVWSVLYVVFVLLHLAVWPRADAPIEADERETIGVRRRISWMLLSAAPCAAMLATTNLLTFDFAAVPLLWIAPLAVYLLTLVLNFQRTSHDRMNSVMLPALGAWVALCLLAAWLAARHADPSAPVQTLRRLLDVAKFGYVTAAVFVVGMVCHKSLYEGRPASARAATGFYAWSAAGGWAGSAAIGLLVPWLGRHAGALWLDWLAAGALGVAALAARDWNRRSAALSAMTAAACALAAFSVRGAGVVYALRNFYGVSSVVEKDGARFFYHGNTDHGAQWLDPQRRHEPLSYYNKTSPLHEAFDALGGRARSIGVVGLGAGGIAAYGRAGQDMVFYELDPDVESIARTYFTYLTDSSARVSVVIGDARLSLERDERTTFDLLILDAFNSGAVPVHLLTKEAIALYMRRLRPGGTLLLHVSNRYLDLRPMLAASTREMGLFGACKRTTQIGKRTEENTPSSWAMVSADPDAVRTLIIKAGWMDLGDPAFAHGKSWTDRHASLLPVLAL